MLHPSGLCTAGEYCRVGKEKSYQRWKASFLEQEILASQEGFIIFAAVGLVA